MSKFWKLQNAVDTNNSSELILEGHIASESWFGDEVTPQLFRDELKTMNVQNGLTVVINSGGGDVFAGLSIYNALKELNATVTVRVDGLAGSIASIIAMAGDKIIMSSGSIMMIHKPSMMAFGNLDDFDKAKEMLKEVESSLLSVYVERTGLSLETVSELVNAETWMRGERAVELGFADEFKGDKDSLTDTIENMLKDNKAFQNSDGKLAISMKSTIESLKHYAETVEPTNEAEEEEEVEVEEVTVEVDEVETTTEAPEEADTTTVEETTVEPTEEITNTVEEVKETEMSEVVDTVVTEGIVTNALPEQPKTVKKVSNLQKRENFLNQLGALVTNNHQALEHFVKEGANFSGVENAVANGENLWVDEVVRNDIMQAYSIVGRVGGLVDRESITADTLKFLVETAGVGFQPVALGAVKPTDTPVWTPLTFEPFEWAVIVPWKDGDQKRTTINIYNQIIQYIAREYAKLEDKIILTYAGGVVGAETRPASGLVPILTTANRDIAVADTSSAAVVSALGEAYGDVETDGTITLVTNRKTWAALATALDGFDRPLFTVVGEQVSAGALGTFNVVLSSVLADGDVVIGNFADYLVVTRGGLGTLFSREADIEGVINLFTQDASALRADVDITGGVKRLESFSLLQIAGVSS